MPCSHWFQMYSTLAMGATTHKVQPRTNGAVMAVASRCLPAHPAAMSPTPPPPRPPTHVPPPPPPPPPPTLPPQDTASRSTVLRAYYTHRLFMGFCCVCCEVLYLMLYLLTWPGVGGPALPLPGALAGLELPYGE